MSLSQYFLVSLIKTRQKRRRGRWGIQGDRSWKTIGGWRPGLGPGFYRGCRSPRRTFRGIAINSAAWNIWFNCAGNRRGRQRSAACALTPIALNCLRLYSFAATDPFRSSLAGASATKGAVKTASAFATGAKDTSVNGALLPRCRLRKYLRSFCALGFNARRARIRMYIFYNARRARNT